MKINIEEWEFNLCAICRKEIGRVNNRGILVDIKKGTIQIGQGKEKHFISFCSRKCYEKFKEEDLK